MANINPVKLKSLRKYFLEGGSTDAEDVLVFLGTDDEDLMDAYVAALRAKYPDEFPGDGDNDDADEEDEVKPRFFLQDGALLKELELVKDKGEKVVFRILEPKELVDIIVAGTVRTVDLVQLRKMSPEDTLYGKPVSVLMALADAARA